MLFLKHMNYENRFVHGHQLKIQKFGFSRKRKLICLASNHWRIWQVCFYSSVEWVLFCEKWAAFPGCVEGRHSLWSGFFFLWKENKNNVFWIHTSEVPGTKEYEPQMPTFHCCMSRTDNITCLAFLWICRGELRTELDFLLLQRAHFWHHLLFYLSISLTPGNEGSSVWAVCFSQHFSVLSAAALYFLLVLTKTNWNKKYTHICKILSVCDGEIFFCFLLILVFYKTMSVLFIGNMIALQSF